MQLINNPLECKGGDYIERPILA